MPICPYTKHPTRRSSGSKYFIFNRCCRWQRRPRVSSEEWIGELDIADSCNSSDTRGTGGTRSQLKEPMAIFPSSGKTSKTSKKTTPRGSNILFNKHQSSQQHPELLQQHPRQGQEEQEKQQQQQPQRLHNQQQLQQHQQQQRTPPQSSFSPVSLAPEKTSDNSPPLTRISMDGSKMSSTERGYEEKGCLLDQVRFV